MSKDNYEQFVQKQVKIIREWLASFDINQKKWKSYNDLLIQFLQWSTLTINNKCNFDITKKNKVLIDILSDVWIIDTDMFDELTKLRNKYVGTKPLGWTSFDYENWTEEIKRNIQSPIYAFVKNRVDQNLEWYVDNQHYEFQKKLSNFDTEIELYEIQISQHEWWNLEYEDILSSEQIEEIKLWIWDLKHEKDLFLAEYAVFCEQYESYKKTYSSKIISFQKKLQILAEKYIFAHTNPIARLKKSYIELFLLDKMDIWFLQWSEYKFSLSEKVTHEIQQKKQSLINIIEQKKPPTQLQFNFDE